MITTMGYIYIERERETTVAACQTWEFSASPDDSIRYNLLPLQGDRPIYSRLQNPVFYCIQGILSDERNISNQSSNFTI